MDPSQYRIETFAPHAGSAFTARLSDGRVLSLQLIEVRPGVSNERVHQFALMFQGPGQPQVVQQTVRMVHGELGEMDLFIVPVGVNENGVQYEAVFSRLIKK